MNFLLQFGDNLTVLDMRRSFFPFSSDPPKILEEFFFGTFIIGY